LEAKEKQKDTKFGYYKKEIDKIITSYIKKKDPVLLYEPSRFALESGGKRIRGILAILGYKIVSNKSINRKIFFASSALEILHLFTLVHDDIMDNADSRRGRPTIHKKWDSNTALLSGDLLVGLAYESLMKADLPQLKNALIEFNKALIEVCEGQAYDKEFEEKDIVSIKEYEMMIQKKTGKLIESSLLIGAILGNAKTKELKALSRYGKMIGRAFQIKDDLLDIIADEKEFGKKNFGDIKESKKTYFYVSALKYFSDDDKNTLRIIFGKQKKSEKEIKKIVELFDSYGLISSAQSEITRLIKKAKMSLQIFKPELRKELELLADKLEIRTY